MLTPHARHVESAMDRAYRCCTEGTVESAERAVKYEEKKTPQFTVITYTSQYSLCCWTERPFGSLA